jgi:hypothetical protein
MPMETDTIEFNANVKGDWFFIVTFFITWWREWVGFLVMKIKNPILIPNQN